jgi:hypothetical protein
MVKVNTENVWRVTSSNGEREWWVKCPSWSGARIWLAEHLNKTEGSFKPHAPFRKGDLPYTPETVPEGVEVLQAGFRAVDDPANWAEGNI